MRYAIYYTPQPGSMLHQLGSRWLGRDVFGGAVSDAVPHLEGYTADARRYGFHATLKAPFRLREGKSAEGLLAHVASLALKTPAVQLLDLQLSAEHGFLALRPKEQGQDLAELERSCVCHLDAFRADPAPEELARRNMAALSLRQKRHLADWGYPYVLDAFRFHITLSRALEGGEFEELHGLAARHFAPVLGQRLSIESITVFLEPSPGADFVALESFALNQSQAAFA